MRAERAERRAERREGGEPEATEAPPAKSSEDLKAELDGILDEIDEVLEENAEQFVRTYVQRGGQ